MSFLITTNEKQYVIQYDVILGAAAAATALAAAQTIDNQSSSSSRKEIAQLVKKTWRSTHIECSAKYNWNMVTIFRELAIMLEMIANGKIIGEQKNTTRKKRCLMF